jgi:hypothetical protein
MPEAVAASAVEYCPAWHRPEQAAGRPRADEKEPAAQDTQVADEMAASAVEYRPATQRPEHAAGSPSADE